MLPNFTTEDISRTISNLYLVRGREYLGAGRVRQFSIHKDGYSISAVVANYNGYEYRAYIRFAVLPTGETSIRGECSCPVGANCEHVAAALFKAQARLDKRAASGKATAPGKAKAPSKVRESAYVSAQVDVVPVTQSALPAEFGLWLKEVELACLPVPDLDVYAVDSMLRLLYVISLNTARNATLSVDFFSAKQLKAGGFGKALPYSRGYNLAVHPPRFFSGRDSEIIAALNAMRADSDARWELSADKGGRVLHEMIATGRCFWDTPDSAPVCSGETRTAKPAWRIDEQGNQKLTFEMAQRARVLPLAPPWYLDLHSRSCGELDTGLPAKLAYALLHAPLIPFELAVPLQAAMVDRTPAAPRPEALVARLIEGLVPVPCLSLSSIRLPLQSDSDRYLRGAQQDYPKILDLAKLEFDYGGTRIRFCTKTETPATITRRQGLELQRIMRNHAAEKHCIDLLAELGFTFAATFLHASEYIKLEAFVLSGEQEWADFCLDGLKKLRALGWQVELEQRFRFNFAKVEDWTATVSEDLGCGWFNLELGIQVDGHAVNLLPVLLDLVRQHPGLLNAASLAGTVAGSPDFIGKLPDGRLLKLAASRVRAILCVLAELFETQAKPSCLELSCLQAARLAELDEAVGGLRWSGGERLLELGKQLLDFKGIKAVAAPASLQAELRGYQQEGLNWLQFLREYQLAGILADDMGLGKTVQALAHLLLEKEAGRLKLPCLIVAPTSLMFNWRREAQRFAPTLRVLVLQGLSRKQHFDSLADYDLVLTTYPLLPRDQEVLTAQEFYYLVLDEAHLIKNPKSQATRIVHQIKAHHRLALSGTPLENHLGELWTQFNFLLPGLLGSEPQFRRLFRNPIEKQGDLGRRSLLARRIAPFLLRRTKLQVAGELPPKTEILRYCQLGGAQRDLYEAIRVSMHEKVLKEIDQKGLNRSQIVILDALLKLRQVCCDPRLLALSAAKRVGQSAKLELLMSLVTEMLQEGRRILLFSQFTSMLALIAQELDKLDLPYLLLTGDTLDRETPVGLFQKGLVPLFLISLKAGGVGLNLTAADTVIHYDPWWNPAAENQATDRAHRIGQVNPVFVYKLIAEGTVEEKIVSMQQSKLDLAKGVLEGGSSAPLSAAELSQLFEPME